MSSVKESVAHSSVWTFRCQVLRVLSLLYLLKTSWDQDSLNIKCYLLLCYTTTLYFTNFVFYVLKHFFSHSTIYFKYLLDMSDYWTTSSSFYLIPSTKYMNCLCILRREAFTFRIEYYCLASYLLTFYK